MYRRKKKMRRRSPQALTTTLKQGFKTKTGRIHMLDGSIVFGLLSATSYGMGAFSYLNNLGLQLKSKVGG